MIINPYDLTTTTVAELYRTMTILPSKDNKQWHATIFPTSTEINETRHSSDRIITKIDDSIFKDFITLNKEIVYVVTENGRKRLKCVEYGSFSDSVKRYTNLDKPISIVEDGFAFLNITKNIPITKQIVTKSTSNTSDLARLRGFKRVILPKPIIIDSNNLSNVQQPVGPNRIIESTEITKFNGKDYLLQVLKWAKEQGITHIYSINEWRPNVISHDWVTNCVYYTIKGVKMPVTSSVTVDSSVLLSQDGQYIVSEDDDFLAL